MIVTCKKRKWHQKDKNLRTEYVQNTCLILICPHYFGIILHPFTVDTKRFHKSWNIMLPGEPVNSLAQFSKNLITWWKKDLVVVGRSRTAGKWNVIPHNSRLLSGTASSNLVNREWPPFTENFWIIARQWLKSAWLPQGFRNFSQGKKNCKRCWNRMIFTGFFVGFDVLAAPVATRPDLLQQR